MECLLKLLGACSAVYLTYKFMKIFWLVVYPHIIAKFIGRVIDVKTLGKWAVITGSTDGIGKGYAKVLAKRGVNVFLISRSEEKLKATADEIRKFNPNIEVRTLAIDFRQATPTTYRTTITDALKDIEVGILVNNVGMSYEYPEEIIAIQGGEQFLQDIIHVNCVSTVQMTKIVLPQMLHRNKGAVINISSAAAFCPLPLLNIYAATKIFMDYLSRGFALEYPDSGIHFQVVHPFYVVTKMSGLHKTSFWIVDPYKFASNALNTVGILSSTSGCLSHDIQRVGAYIYLALFPTGYGLRNGILEIKKRFLRNLQKESKVE